MSAKCDQGFHDPETVEGTTEVVCRDCGEILKPARPLPTSGVDHVAEARRQLDEARARKKAREKGKP